LALIGEGSTKTTDQDHCIEQEGEPFMAVQITTPLVKIVSKLDSGKVLDIKQASMENNTPLILHQAHGRPNQQWLLINVEKVNASGLAYKFIVCVQSGKVLDVKEGSIKNGTPIIQNSCYFSYDQLFVIEDLGNGFVKIVTYLDRNMALDVTQGSTADRTPIILHQYHGGDNQQWRLEPLF
jgi:Ricin-type beta-trefoil lectin domain-like